VLEGFGASRTYAQDLIGDLAEEFALRAERDGHRSARSWYRAQTLRSVPHLFIDWFRTARRHDYVRALTAVWIAYCCVAGMGVMALASLRAVVAAAGHPLLVIPPAATVVVGMIVALACGYIVAALSQDAPLIAAFAFVVLVSATNLAVAAVVGLHVWGFPRPPVSSITVVAVWLLMAPSGAILRMSTARRESA
jgi:predicted tellurium resistance membrane protein TerC